MPNFKLEDLEGGQKKITIEITPEEVKPFAEEAAKEISKEVKIKGFRPGHAPYDMVVEKVGEMAVLEKAVDRLVRHFYKRAVLENELDVVGPPQVDVKQLAPENNVVFEAVASLLPQITKLAEWRKMSVKKVDLKVTDKELKAAITDLCRMRTVEVRATSGTALSEGDKAVIDLEMKKDGVPVEGGTSKGAMVVMSQESYLPGMKEAISGLKEGEEKDFEITFPKDHFQKMLAGKKVNVHAKLNEIFHLETPKADDALAVSLGLKDLAELKVKLTDNITSEKEVEDAQRIEREMLESIIKKSEFTTVPRILLEEELQKMVHELRENVTRQGLDFETYLSSIKKTADELIKELEPQAELRVKIAILLGEVAKKEELIVKEEAIDAEIDRISEMYKDNKESRERVFGPEFRSYQTRVMENRLVLDLLKKEMVK